jgi:hypothetical protein
MRTLILPFLLVPVLASAQPAKAPAPYESPANVAKRLKAQCAALAPQQRPDCEKKARAAITSSIDRHHQLKGTARKSAARPAPPAPAKGAPPTVTPKPAPKK